MKDFKYYSTPSMSYFGYDESKKMLASLTKEVNEAQMTATERIEALDKIPRRVREYAKIQNAPYNEKCRELDLEFYTDAREELGYDKILNEGGCMILESKAYERGHSSGHAEVFYILGELTDFVKEIKECLLT